MSTLSAGGYATGGDISARVRALINDMINDADGDVFADDNASTFPLIQSAYETFQDALVDAGSDSTYRVEAVLTNLRGVNTNDPSAQVELSFDGYFDGTNTYATPALPAGLIEPERLWERPNGSTGSSFTPMHGPESDGLPQTATVNTGLRSWEWRGNSIYFPAPSQATDIRVRYLTYAPDIIDATSQVMILRAVEPIALITAYKFALSRGSAAAAAFKTDAQTAVDQIINREIKAKQRHNTRRKGYGRCNTRRGWRIA